MSDEKLRLLRDAIDAMLGQSTSSSPRAAKPAKKKRKVSKYNRVYSKHFKRLKRKHPRTAFQTLSKRAHRATKKELK